MSGFDIVLMALALGVTIGAVPWERLRGDLKPRLRNSRNAQRRRELSERLAQLEGQLSGA